MNTHVHNLVEKMQAVIMIWVSYRNYLI